jgi:hypothetical protein
MGFFKQWGSFMMMGARAHAIWEIEISNTIVNDRKRMVILALLIIPIIMGGIAIAGDPAAIIPDVLGGKKAYSPAYFTPVIFIASILIGLGAGLITGCIGAGGGFIIAPALMSAGVKHHWLNQWLDYMSRPRRQIEKNIDHLKGGIV